jgi:hypothetical protein
MADIYSVTFIAAPGVTDSVSYTVPDGFTAVVTGVDLYLNGIPATEAFFEGTAGQAVWATGIGETTNTYQSWRGRMAATEGQTFGVHVTNDQAWDVTVSGYLLTNP